MKRFLIPLVILSILLVPAAASAGHGFMEEIVAYANSKQEVPSFPSDTSGTLNLNFRLSLRSVAFELSVFDGIDIVAAHLHCGVAGTNGPVLAVLFAGAPVDPDGLIAAGVIRNGDIFEQTAEVCGVPINNIASLFAAIRKDLIYLNVHSLANLGGEVRAQIFLP